MKKKKISVIIPTFNGERTIERAIKSIINQEGKWNFEVLVCDDCSTDKTVEIAKKLGTKRLMNKRHTGGPNKGRNNGIDRATGEYIAFLDQDDEWLPDKINLQIKALESADVVSSRKIIIYE